MLVCCLLGYGFALVSRCSFRSKKLSQLAGRTTDSGEEGDFELVYAQHIVLRAPEDARPQSPPPQHTYTQTPASLFLYAENRQK